MNRWATSLLLAGAMLVPVAAVRAQDRDDRHDRDRDRVEQRDDRAYRQNRHVWNDNEDRYYRQYLQERNRQYREWNRASRRQQRNYWRWRDRHPDFDRQTPRNTR